MKPSEGSQGQCHSEGFHENGQEEITLDTDSIFKSVYENQGLIPEA